MSEVSVKRYGVHYEDLHDGVEASEDNGVVSMVQISDHLAAMEAKDREIEGLRTLLVEARDSVAECANYEAQYESHRPNRAITTMRTVEKIDAILAKEQS